MLESKETFSFLNFVRYKSMLDGWSAYSLLGDTLQYNEKYPLQEIGSFLTRNKTETKIKDEVLYKRPTIKLYNQGIQLRDIEKGSSIGTKNQFLIKQGQFLLSKIDARNGAFGVVPQECDGAIITGNFWTFDVDYEKINPYYLALVTSSKQFHKYCQSASVGTTGRNYLQEELFLKIKIPLPNISEQQILVDSYNQAISEAKEAEEKANNIDINCKIYLNEQVGLSFIKNEAQKGLQFLRFKDTLQRWDPYVAEAILTGNFPLIKVKDLLKSISTGTTPPTANPEYFNGDINFYTPAELSDEMYLYNSERKVSELAIKHKKARVFHKNTLLFVGIGSTVGKVGLVGNDIATANQQITGLVFDDTKINPEFAFYFFHYNKDITVKDQSKTTLPIVNQEKIESIEIPLPPLDIQKAIVDFIKTEKLRANKLKQKAETLKTKAKEQFEMELFEA